MMRVLRQGSRLLDLWRGYLEEARSCDWAVGLRHRRFIGVVNGCVEMR